jgi:hypothetical protein
MCVLAGFADGYPVMVGTGLPEGKAKRLHHYLHEGNFLRASLTRQLHAFLLVRSAMLRAMGIVHLSFQWLPHGRISMTSVKEVGLHPCVPAVDAEPTLRL